MEQMVDFKCGGENLEQIPEAVKAATGISFPTAHQSSRDIAVLASALRYYKQDVICRVPFCVTVEAEALGGHIKLGDDKFGPRVENYAFSSLEEMQHIVMIDFGKGRIKEVLDSVELLSNQGEAVALSIEGPFTIISSLIEPMTFYKEIRKDKEQTDRLMEVIEDNIIRYMLEGIRRGAKILSYGDPAGSMDIVGPKVYREISGKISYNILKRVEGQLAGAIVHLCGKTSTACSQLGLCKAEPIEQAEGITYGAAVMKLLEEGNTKFIGHSCIKRTPFLLAKPVVWGITLI